MIEWFICESSHFNGFQKSFLFILFITLYYSLLQNSLLLHPYILLPLFLTARNALIAAMTILRKNLTA